MPDRDDAMSHRHQHKGKSSESLINKEILLERLDLRPGLAVLDAGCGDGYMSLEFSRLVGGTGKVYALDPDSRSIETLKGKTGKTNIVPVVGDITKRTPFEGSSMDLVYLSTVIHGFSAADLAGFVKEVTRLLKPGGRLAIVEIKKEETPFGPPMEIRFSPEELKRRVPLTASDLVEAGEFFYMQVFEK